MTVLEYQGLTLTADTTPILDHIDARIEGPGVFAILGPSGVGKSSLLRATQRLVEHGRDGWRREGDIRFNGESVFSPRVRKQELARRLGFVQQRPRVLGGSVLANVEFALRHTTRLSRPEIRRKAAAALEQVGLSAELPDLEQTAWRLSGGQIQRLAIARAIALDPEALLMDEPISALDPMAAECVEQVIRDLAVDHLIVLVTHKVGLAVRLAGRAGFILRGDRGARLVEVGEAPAIFDHPSDPVAREFIQMGYGPVVDKPVPEPPSPEPPTVEPTSLEPASLGRRLYLFVCGHNTQRSPMAQAICNAEIVRRLGGDITGEVHALSAGLAIDPSQPLAVSAREALEELGFPVPDHVPEELSCELVERADVIYCMTEEQCREVGQRFPSAKAKVERLDPISDLGSHEDRTPELFLATARRLRDTVRWRLGQDFVLTTQIH